jgi:hypothetical protein
MWESVYIIWNQNVETALGRIDLTNLKDFHVVAKHITGHLERSDINHLYIWVFQGKYST